MHTQAHQSNIVQYPIRHYCNYTRMIGLCMCVYTERNYVLFSLPCTDSSSYPYRGILNTPKLHFVVTCGIDAILSSLYF